MRTHHPGCATAGRDAPASRVAPQLVLHAVSLLVLLAVPPLAAQNAAQNAAPPRTPPAPITRGAVAAASPEWRAVARAREAWRARTESFVEDSLRRVLSERADDDAAWLALARLTAERFAWDSAQVLRLHARPGAVRALERARDLHRTRRFRDALPFYDDAIHLARASHDTLVLAEALLRSISVRGRVIGAAAYRATWDSLRPVLPAAAPPTWRFATCLAEALEASDGTRNMAMRLRARADSFAAAGDAASAAVCYDVAASLREPYAGFSELDSLHLRAYALHGQARDGIEQAQALNLRGYVRARAGYSVTARAQLRRALPIAMAAGALTVEGAIHMNLARAALSDGDLDAAARGLALARIRAEQAGDGQLLASVAIVERLLALSRGEHDAVYRQASRRYDSLHAATEVPPTEAFAIAASHALDAAVRAGDTARIRRWLPRHDSLGTARGSTWRAVTDWEVGVAWLRLGEADSAAARFEQALPLYAQSPAVRARILAQLAHAAALQGDVVRAVQLADSSLTIDDAYRATLETSRLRAASRADAFAFGGPHSGAGIPAVVAALAARGAGGTAWRLAEWLHHRTVRDAARLRPATYDSAARDAITALTAPLPSPAADEAWITWVLGPDDVPSTALLVTREGISARTLPPRRDLEPVIQRFTTAAATGADTDSTFTDALARTLGDELLGDLLDAVPPSVRHLVLLPDDLLHRVPFALLARGGRPRLARLSLSVLPSIRLRETLRQAPVVTQGDVLVFADPVAPSDDSVEGARNDADDAHASASLDVGSEDWRRPLRGARAEADSLRALYPQARVRAASDASETALSRAWLSQPALVHIAAHAIADDRAEDGSLLILAAGEGNDGFVTGSELARLRLRGALVVLSACRTSRAPVTGGDLTNGVASALLLGGARAVVATQWEMRDDRLPAFAAAFHRALIDGADAAGALAAAQSWARAQGWPARDWAGVQLLGDGRWTLPRAVVTRAASGERR